MSSDWEAFSHDNRLHQSIDLPPLNITVALTIRQSNGISPYHSNLSEHWPQQHSTSVSSKHIEGGFGREPAAIGY